jgi:uncharacterized repeat protein (TIGR03806 family)
MRAALTAALGRAAMLGLAWAAAGCSAPAPNAASPGPRLDLLLAEAPAPKLSDYALFTDETADTPAKGVAAYTLINPLFSDHAAKHRFVFVPGGQMAAYHASDVFEFPVGSTLIKTFAYAPDMRTPENAAFKVETRLLIRQAAGWAAYPYVWNAAGTEAVYTPAGTERDIAFTDTHGAAQTVRYQVPNKNQCKTCHQAGDSVRPIGPKARNLNAIGPHGVNQLADWQARGILAHVPRDAPVAAAVGDTSLPLEARARAYLDINCGHCHKASGSASNSGLWLETGETAPVKIGFGKHPTAAGRGSGDRLVVIEPGAPDASILTYRMASREPGVAMPELGRTLTDQAGLELVRAWISEMPETRAD